MASWHEKGKVTLSDNRKAKYVNKNIALDCIKNTGLCILLGSAKLAIRCKCFTQWPRGYRRKSSNANFILFCCLDELYFLCCCVLFFVFSFEAFDICKILTQEHDGGDSGKACWLVKKIASTLRRTSSLFIISVFTKCTKMSWFTAEFLHRRIYIGVFYMYSCKV